MSEAVDIVIPLGCGSQLDNLELRMALRSIAQNGRNVGEIFIVAETLPAWCQKVHHLAVTDCHAHNKDANIIDKLLAACRTAELRERFLFWSDDQLAFLPFDAAALIPVFNDRRAEDFQKRSIWHQRMRHTFDFLAKRGIRLNWNWDSHVPQPMEKSRFCQLIAPVDYATLPGYCVNTLYFGLNKVKPLLEQSTVKCTLESSVLPARLPRNKLFWGYNDAALAAGLANLLKARFPNPSPYEK